MKILIGTGPTREYLDPVRFISNPSTGKMGYLIAEECIRKGYAVTIVSGPTNLKPPSKAKFIPVISAAEMKREILKNFPGTDILIMCAAVSDWKPAVMVSGKIKCKKSWNLKLVPNPDILKEAGKIKKKNQKMIGFALETSDILKNAEKKLKEKKLDLIIADTPDFFGERKKTSRVIFIHKDGKIENFNRAAKQQIARKLAALLSEL